MFVNSADSFYYPEMGLTQETEYILKNELILDPQRIPWFDKKECEIYYNFFFFKSPKLTNQYLDDHEVTSLQQPLNL